MTQVTNAQIEAELTIIKNILETKIGYIESDTRLNRDKIIELDKAIRGNGTPGLNTRIVAVEEFMHNSKNIYGAVIIAIVVDAILRGLTIFYGK